MRTDLRGPLALLLAFALYMATGRLPAAAAEALLGFSIGLTIYGLWSIVGLLPRALLEGTRLDSPIVDGPPAAAPHAGDVFQAWRTEPFSAAPLVADHEPPLCWDPCMAEAGEVAR